LDWVTKIKRDVLRAVKAATGARALPTQRQEAVVAILTMAAQPRLYSAEDFELAAAALKNLRDPKWLAKVADVPAYLLHLDAVAERVLKGAMLPQRARVAKPRKKAPAKKTPAKKAPAKKTPAKKTPAKKTSRKKR
jgi:hypothetical protein